MWLLECVLHVKIWVTRVTTRKKCWLLWIFPWGTHTVPENNLPCFPLTPFWMISWRLLVCAFYFSMMLQLLPNQFLPPEAHWPARELIQDTYSCHLPCPRLITHSYKGCWACGECQYVWCCHYSHFIEKYITKYTCLQKKANIIGQITVIQLIHHQGHLSLRIMHLTTSLFGSKKYKERKREKIHEEKQESMHLRQNPHENSLWLELA